MDNFKKALVSFLSLFIVFLIFVFVVIEPFFENGSYANDSSARIESAGKIDYIFCGASHGLNAFNPKIADEQLGVFSWNLSATSASFWGRKKLIENEISRNNVDTLILEIAYDSMTASQKDRNGFGEPVVLAKLDNNKQRIEHLRNSISFINGDYEHLLYMLMRYGLKAWRDKTTNLFGEMQKSKGYYYASEIVDMRLSESDIQNSYNIVDADMSFLDENKAVVSSIIDECQNKNIRVIVVVTPISDNEIWKQKNLDSFHNELQEFCQEQQCLLYDFNLDKNRYQMYSDEYSFVNNTHMSYLGAEQFTKRLCEIITLLNNNSETDSLFYKSYNEMKRDSPYVKN